MTRDLINDWPLWVAVVTYRDWYWENEAAQNGRKMWYEWTEDPFDVRARDRDAAIATIETLAAFASEQVVTIVLAPVGGARQVEVIEVRTPMLHQPWCSWWSPCHSDEHKEGEDQLPW